MKSCPTCSKTFPDPNLSFCIDDGTPLFPVAEPADESTDVSPSLGDSESNPAPTDIYKPRDWQAPDYQPPGFQSSTAAPVQKKTWPWVVGILAGVGLGVIAIGVGGLLVYKLVRPGPVRNNSNSSVERSGDPNTNLNSNESGSRANNENSDAPVDEDDATPPPTDPDVVLATLRDLENEWEVANINADKQKLNRILAADYVGTSSDGVVHGKAEYLRTITRDTAIQKWEFEDLRLTLMGGRATLDGVIRLQLPAGEAAYKFTDKFVWRDGRWQAVASELSRIK